MLASSIAVLWVTNNRKQHSGKPNYSVPYYRRVDINEKREWSWCWFLSSWMAPQVVGYVVSPVTKLASWRPPVSYQRFRYLWHHWLSSWQFSVPPLTIQLTSWRLSGFSDNDRKVDVCNAMSEHHDHYWVAEDPSPCRYMTELPS